MKVPLGCLQLRNVTLYTIGLKNVTIVINQGWAIGRQCANCGSKVGFLWLFVEAIQLAELSVYMYAGPCSWLSAHRAAIYTVPQFVNLAHAHD